MVIQNFSRLHIINSLRHPTKIVGEFLVFLKSINLVKDFFSKKIFQNYLLPTRLCSLKMSLNQRIPDVQKLLSTAATVAATAMLVRSIAYDYIPNDIHRYLFSHLQNLPDFSRLDSPL